MNPFVSSLAAIDHFADWCETRTRPADDARQRSCSWCPAYLAVLGLPPSSRAL